MSLLLTLALLASTLTPDVKALLSEGLAFREAGRDAEALSKFRNAYSLSGSPQALAQMALAEQALGRWLAAREHLEEALAYENHVWIKKYRSALQSGLKTIKSRIAEVEILTSVPGVNVSVNGRKSGVTPLATPVWVKAGTVVIEVSAKGYWPITRQIEVPPRAQAVESFRLVRKGIRTRDVLTSAPANRPGTQSPQAISTTNSTRGFEPWIWTSGALGLAGIGTGVGFLIAREISAAEFNDECRGQGLDNLDCVQQREAVDENNTIMVASLVTGGVFMGTAVLLYFLNRSSQPSSTVDISVGSSVMARCAQGPGTFGIACGVNF